MLLNCGVGFCSGDFDQSILKEDPLYLSSDAEAETPALPLVAELDFI